MEGPPALPAIVPASQVPAQASPPAVLPEHLYAALLSDARKAPTRTARVSDIRDLGRHLGEPDPEVLCARLVLGGRGAANAMVSSYMAGMLERGLSPATINRRLSTVAKVVELANRYDLCSWSLTIDTLPSQSYRDTEGPGRAGWIRIYDLAKKQARGGTPDGRRDLAIVCCLYFSGLRRAAVAGLDLADWHPDSAKLMILGKRRHEKTPAPGPNAETIAALEAWIDVRGDAPGPLFCRLDHASARLVRPRNADAPLERLSGRAIWDLVRQLGRRAGLKTDVRPHGLRHQAATELARRTGGDVLSIQQFLGHSDPKTTAKYVDNLKDVAGEMSRKLSEG